MKFKLSTNQFETEIEEEEKWFNTINNICGAAYRLLLSHNRNKPVTGVRKK